MRIIMVAATSKDGFITKGLEADISSWVSAEDKAFFSSLKAKHKLFVMGSKTYDAIQPNPSQGTLRIVLTSQPERYLQDEIPGQLEFKNLSPVDFYNTYRKAHSSCLLLGGSQLYEDFMCLSLVDEVYLTLEPVIHVQGTMLFSSGRSLSDFVSVKPTEKLLNPSGTKLLHYTLKK